LKQGTPDNPKMGSLARALGELKPTAGGILEFLWHFAARYAHNGELTKFEAEQIAEAIYWPQERAAELIEALIRTRWLDRVGDRLLIHDWPENCVDSVHKYLAYHHLWFADGTAPRLGLLGREDRVAAKAWYDTHVPTTSSTPVVYKEATSSLPVIVPSPSPSPSPSPKPHTPPDEPAEGVGVSASPEEPMGKKPTKAKADRKPNPFTDAFKMAFDETFPDVGGYAWTRSDFGRLAKWRTEHPDIGPERFVEVARRNWARGEFTPRAALNIGGLAGNWSTLAAFKPDGGNGDGRRPERDQTPVEERCATAHGQGKPEEIVRLSKFFNRPDLLEQYGLTEETP